MPFLNHVDCIILMSEESRGFHDLNKDELILLIMRMRELYQPQVECRIKLIDDTINALYHHTVDHCIPLAFRILANLDPLNDTQIRVYICVDISTEFTDVSLNIIGELGRISAGRLPEFTYTSIKGSVCDIIDAFIMALPQWRLFRWDIDD